MNLIYVFSVVETHMNIYYDIKEDVFISFADRESKSSKEFVYPFGLSLIVTPVVRLLDNNSFVNHNFIFILISLMFSLLLGIITQKIIFSSVYKKTLKKQKTIVEISKEEFLSKIQVKLKLFTNGIVTIGIFILVFLFFMYQNSNFFFFFFSQLGSIFMGTIISAYIMTIKNRNTVIKLKRW